MIAPTKKSVFVSILIILLSVAVGSAWRFNLKQLYNYGVLETNPTSLSVTAQRRALKDAELIFIGHAYGRANGKGDIPYPPLGRFLVNKALAAKHIFFLGDMVEKSTDLVRFLEYASQLSGHKHYIRGNHDGSLDHFRHLGLPTSIRLSLNNKYIEGFDFPQTDLRLDQSRYKEFLSRAAESSTKFVLSHYVFWWRITRTLVDNSNHKAPQNIKDVLPTIEDKDITFVAGDSGKSPLNSGYFYKRHFGNTFVSTGMGGGAGIDHILTWNSKDEFTPVFFNQDGTIRSAHCRSRILKSETICDGRNVDTIH